MCDACAAVAIGAVLLGDKEKADEYKQYNADHVADIVQPGASAWHHAPGGFLSHHLARISMAAVYWDAQHIDEGVRFLKKRARPHA